MIISRKLHVLFLCTGSWARSILAEALLDRWGEGQFNAYSAGSFPKGAVHLLALELVAESGLPTRGLRSKGWEESARPGAPAIDLVITICDNAAGEVCPLWPGKPVTSHWSIPDPAAAGGSGDERRAAFRDAFRRLERRIRLLAALPIDDLDPASLKHRAEQMGRPFSTEET